MTLESRQDLIDGGQVLNKTHFLTESTTLTVNQQVAECVTGAAVDVTLTLPAVIEATGRHYSISLITDGGFDVVVQDQDDSRDWTDLTLDTANDYALLYSDGRKWFTLDSEVA